MQSVKIPVNALPKEDPQVKIIPLGDDMPYDFKRPHRHDYFEFFVFSHGGGSHYIDFTEYPIKENSVHIVFPSQIHLLKRKGGKGKIIICTKEFMNSLGKVFYAQLFQNNFTAPYIPLSAARFSEISLLLDGLVAEVRSGNYLASELTRSYLTIFLAHCIRDFVPQSQRAGAALYTPHDLEVYRKFFFSLEDHFLEQKQVSFYADTLALTPKVLNNCIRKITGKTCADIIQERTLTEAKRLLLYSDKSSKEIAFELNFNDSSYFTRFFTRLQGQTPLAFKNYWEEKYHS